MFIYETKFIAV